MTDPFKPWPNNDGKIPMVSPHGTEDVIFVDQKHWDYFRECGWISAYEYYRNLWWEAEKSKAKYTNRLKLVKLQFDRDESTIEDATSNKVQSSQINKSKKKKPTAIVKNVKPEKEKPTVIKTAEDLAAVSGTFAAEMDLKKKQKK